MSIVHQDNLTTSRVSLPSWFRQDLPDVSRLERMRGILRRNRLETVCQHARCPNTTECWQRGTATFLILGDTCTRACRFCSVPSGGPRPLDPGEPHRVAQTVGDLALEYVVITSVTRDDLPDGGAAHFAATVEQIRRVCPAASIELLIPDFQGQRNALEKIAACRPQVVGHNLETVRRLQPLIRPQADYDRSLAVLKTLRDIAPSIVLKSGFMAGLGETAPEIRALIADVWEAGCEILTIGQYLAPGRNGRHVPVSRFVTPQEFHEFESWGQTQGFRFVMSGPLVRSSYFAERGYRLFSDDLRKEGK